MNPWKQVCYKAPR